MTRVRFARYWYGHAVGSVATIAGGTADALIRRGICEPAPEAVKPKAKPKGKPKPKDEPSGDAGLQPDADDGADGGTADD